MATWIVSTSNSATETDGEKSMTSADNLNGTTPGTPTPDAPRASGINISVLAGNLLAALLGGIAGGILSRIAMRWVTLVTGQSASFSLAGTMAILLVFLIFALMMGILYTLLQGVLPKSRRLRVLLVGAIFTAAIMPFFAQTATADAPDAAASTLIAVLGGFAVIPFGMGFVQVYAGDVSIRRMQDKFGAHISAGWLVALLVSAGLLLGNLLQMGDQLMRHPRLYMQVMDLFGSGDISLMRGNSFAFALVQMVAWCGIVMLIAWRDAQAGRSQLRSVLLLLLPVTTLFSAGKLPPLLSGLGDSAWLLGVVQAIGLAIVLWLLAAVHGGASMARWGIAIAGWAVAAAWLIVTPLRDLVWMEWLVWSLMAVAAILLVLPQQRAWHWGIVVAFCFVGYWLAAWAAAIALPNFALNNFTGYQAAMSAPLSWLPWLLLPLAFAAEKQHIAAPARLEAISGVS